MLVLLSWVWENSHSRRSSFRGLGHEHGEKQVAMFLCFEEGTALITTAGNEVEVSGAVKTFWLAVHTNKVEARKRERGDGGHLPAVTKLAFGKAPFSKSARRGAPRVILT
jgi:hypothetical protein